MTKWIFLFITFITLATLTDASTMHPVIQFMEKHQFSHPAHFEFVLSCEAEKDACTLFTSDEKIRLLKGTSAEEALQLIQNLGMDPDGAYISCRNSFCRRGNVPAAII